MKLICSREKLLDGLNISQRAITGRGSLAISDCVLIDAEYENGFCLLGNDLELGIKTSIIEATVMEQGQIAVEVKMFTDIIRKMSGDMISISSLDNNVILIKSGKSEFRILGLDGEDFPRLPDVEKENCFSLKAARLKNMIKQTIFSVSTDDSKPAFTGELLEIEDGTLNIVAVDGFRVSYIKEPLENSMDAMVIVPAKALNELSKIMPSDGDSLVTCYFTKKHILFEMDSCIVISRLLDGEFLKYKQIFTEDHTLKVIVDRAQFLLSLERASLISKDSRKYPIKLEISGDNMVITSNTEIGTVFDEIMVEMEGQPIDIAFNPKYLIDALRVMDGERISIQFTSSLSPCIVKDLENDSLKYLALPLRIKS